MSENDDLNQGAKPSVSLAPTSWGDVLDAYRAEQVAQGEYEELVCSSVATQVPLDWEVMNPLLVRRKATHETFLRTYRLWVKAKTQRNGYGHVSHVGQAHPPGSMRGGIDAAEVRAPPARARRFVDA